MKTVINVIRVLFAVRKPLADIAGQAKEIKRGWKTPAFWVTLLGSLLAAVAALQGVIPATAALVAVSILTAVYNIVRGVKKSEESGARGIFRTTEFWMAALGEVSKAIVAMQTGGVNPEFFAALTSLVAVATTVAQNLAAREPMPIGQDGTATGAVLEKAKDAPPAS